MDQPSSEAIKAFLEEQEALLLSDTTPSWERRRRALIAEDEVIILLLLRKALEEDGYEVVGMASDGVQAVEQARETRPDFVLMDVNMPGMSGIEATRLIMDERPVPVIILTAYEDHALVDAAVEAGACAYLVKPIATSALLPTLKRAFQLYDRMQLLHEDHLAQAAG